VIAGAETLQTEETRYEPDPDHETVAIGDQGTTVLTRITRETEKWHLELAAELKSGELRTALR
jgi:hypothetical protein